jgi:hypothetical protein
MDSEGRVIDEENILLKFHVDYFAYVSQCESTETELLDTDMVTFGSGKQLQPCHVFADDSELLHLKPVFILTMSCRMYKM